VYVTDAERYSLEERVVKDECGGFSQRQETLGALRFMVERILPVLNILLYRKECAGFLAFRDC
jgi:hypothetical protein